MLCLITFSYLVTSSYHLSERVYFCRLLFNVWCFIHVIDMWTFVYFQPEPSPTTGSLFKPRPVHVNSSSYTGRTLHQNTFTEHKSTEFEFRPPASNMVLFLNFPCVLLWGCIVLISLLISRFMQSIEVSHQYRTMDPHTHLLPSVRPQLPQPT